MGFWRKLKKESRKSHDALLRKIGLGGKNRAVANTVVKRTPGLAQLNSVGSVLKKTVKNSNDPRDLLGNLVRYSSKEAEKQGKIIGTMGNYLVITGEATGQPELVAMGKEAEGVSDAVTVATSGAADLAGSLDDLIKGDPKGAVVALGKAVKEYGVAVLDTMTDGETSHALEIAEDIMEGDFSSAQKEAARALLDGVANELDASHVKDQAAPLATAGLDMLVGQGQKNSSRAMHGGQAADQGSMDEPISAASVPNLDDFPGTAARAEETLPAGDPSPTEETVTEARVALEAKAAVNQNLDDEMTMCGGARLGHHLDAPILDRHGGERIHGMAGPYKIREHKRAYSALGVTPVQYQNAGMSVANRLDVPVKVARVTSMVHENPLKTKLKKRPTVRGFSANYTTKPRQAQQKGDARGDTVRYVDALRALKGTVQRDETDIARDKSMAGVLQTVPEESLVIDAQGPMKSTTRSRMVTRSMRKHEREMGSVVKSKDV